MFLVRNSLASPQLSLSILDIRKGFKRLNLQPLTASDFQLHHGTEKVGVGGDCLISPMVSCRVHSKYLCFFMFSIENCPTGCPLRWIFGVFASLVPGALEEHCLQPSGCKPHSIPDQQAESRDSFPWYTGGTRCRWNHSGYR